jgi:hypothetical protein
MMYSMWIGAQRNNVPIYLESIAYSKETTCEDISCEIIGKKPNKNGLALQTYVEVTAHQHNLKKK